MGLEKIQKQGRVKTQKDYLSTEKTVAKGDWKYYYTSLG